MLNKINIILISLLCLLIILWVGFYFYSSFYKNIEDKSIEPELIITPIDSENPDTQRKNKVNF